MAEVNPSGRRKLVFKGNNSRVDGFEQFERKVLRNQPLITYIRMGRISVTKPIGRKAKKKVSDDQSPVQSRSSQSIRRKRLGGGFSFKATRWIKTGQKTTSIRCLARSGTIVQEVALSGPDLDALKRWLVASRYADNFTDD